jgi:hypothetical protein
VLPGQHLVIQDGLVVVPLILMVLIIADMDIIPKDIVMAQEPVIILGMTLWMMVTIVHQLVSVRQLALKEHVMPENPIVGRIMLVQ